MRPLKLHTKTTLLASAITLAVLGVVLALVSVRFAQRVRDQQKELAQLQADNLAQHISEMPAPRAPAQLARVATLVHGSRPDALTVRVWERVGGVFQEVAASAENRQAEEIPDDVKAALRSGLATKVVEARPEGADDSLYRVFAPVWEDERLSGPDRRVSGAVEVIEKLDSAPSIAWDYGRGALWLAPLAVLLITLGIFLLFRHFVYQPVERLLGAMERVRGGDLQAQAPEVARADEMGRLTRGFNRMLTRLREMTAEREAQSRVLERRVGEATAELAERNEQLEDANLELYRTARRLTELERLAAAGQLAAWSVRLDAELAAGLPPVGGDPDRLQQVFINLFNNALDAMPEGGELRVTTSFEAGRPGEGRVVVDFSDTGTGMTEEVRAHIFDPLYTTKKRGRGTGLGLVVVRQVVGEHGGSIEVESEPGRGARFRLSFPVAAQSEPNRTASVSERVSTAEVRP